MTAGRPTEYRETLGDELINLMAQGYSLTAAAASLGFHRDTMYDWATKYPAFSDAVKLAKGKRVHKLETDLLAAPDGPTVTSRIFALKNADPTEWREKVEQVHSDPDGKPLKGIEVRFVSGPAGVAGSPSPNADEDQRDGSV